MARGFPYEDLKDFLGALEKAGELHRVTAPVDPTLEVSEIVTRTVEEVTGRPARSFRQWVADHPDAFVGETTI